MIGELNPLTFKVILGGYVLTAIFCFGGFYSPLDPFPLGLLLSSSVLFCWVSFRFIFVDFCLCLLRGV